MREKEIVPYLWSERLQQAIFLNKAAPTRLPLYKTKLNECSVSDQCAFKSSQERIYTFYFVIITLFL